MIFYLPLVAGLAVLIALLVIRFKGSRSYFSLVAWVAAAVIVAQLVSGIFFVIAPPNDFPGIGVILIVMAIVIVTVTAQVYRSLRAQGKKQN